MDKDSLTRAIDNATVLLSCLNGGPNAPRNAAHPAAFVVEILKDLEALREQRAAEKK